MTTLRGRRALITGSFQGIGLGIARALAQEGVSIILHGLADEATIKSAEKEIIAAGASSVESYVTDLRDVNSTLDLSRDILKQGPLDIL